MPLRANRASEENAFHTTRWTLVQHARGESPEARQALGELCAGYYEPVVTFLRSRSGNDDSARELAHAFFARVLAAGSLGGADPARGHFRSYLLGAVKHFLSDESDRASAEKRGGDVERTTVDSATRFPRRTPAKQNSPSIASGRSPLSPAPSTSSAPNCAMREKPRISTRSNRGSPAKPLHFPKPTPPTRLA